MKAKTGLSHRSAFGQFTEARGRVCRLNSVIDKVIYGSYNKCVSSSILRRMREINPSTACRFTMSKVSKRHPIVMPTMEEDKAITAAARSDPDAQPLTPTQLKAMVPLRARRGRPKSENKKLLVSVRYSPEVIEFFKSTGEGWQSRMDGVLLKYIARQSRRA